MNMSDITNCKNPKILCSNLNIGKLTSYIILHIWSNTSIPDIQVFSQF